MHKILGAKARQLLIPTILVCLLAAISPATALGTDAKADEINQQIGVPPKKALASTIMPADLSYEGAWVPGKEMVKLRTATSKTVMGDSPGNFVDQIATEPIHYREGADWKTIDSDLGASRNGKRSNKANRFALNLNRMADTLKSPNESQLSPRQWDDPGLRSHGA